MKFICLKSSLYSLLLLIGVLSCEQVNTQKELISGLYPQHMDSTVKPGDNFHMFVNGKWIKETPIPDDKSRYGIANILYDKSQEDVKAIIEESAAGDFEMGSDEQKVGDLYASFMNMELRNELGLKPIQAELDKVDSISSADDLDSYFAYAGIYGVNVPIGMWVGPDAKIPTKYAVHFWQGGLGLPDREYYLSDNGDFPAIRADYTAHIGKMLTASGLDGSDDVVSQIMKLETALAQNHWPKEDNRDLVKRYNKFAVDSLDALMPRFDWDPFFTDSYLEGLDTVLVSQPSFVLSLNELLTAYDIDTWKNYLKWLQIDNAASRLHAELDSLNFEFYSKRLRGVESQRPMWRRGVSVVNKDLGEVVGKVYVNRHFPLEAKSRMVVLVGNLIKAYEISINELDWMGEETKAEALVKLSKFTTKIGYPDQWKDYSALKIDPAEFFENRRRANLAVHIREMSKIGKPIDKTEWYMNPQTINAYYNSTMNEIVFPAAILQAPFFDLNADDAVNYGAIGAIIGHEIGHGFDDKGSQSDGTGQLRNWWTDEDRDEFEKRTSALVEQFNSYEALDSVYVNGAFTLGENIGDLGGLSIALKAYKMSLNGQEAPVMGGVTGIQRVFLGYAQAWLGKMRDEALKVRINSDPHSPGQFRVNGIVRNVPEFYEAFNVQPGDSLYLAPEDRVKIW